jgi:hypothetical protein
MLLDSRREGDTFWTEWQKVYKEFVPKFLVKLRGIFDNCCYFLFVNIWASELCWAEPAVISVVMKFRLHS